MTPQSRFGTQIVGPLPVVTAYFEMLGLGALVDELVPWEGEVPLGTLVEILVANRLLRPKALFRIEDWATGAGLMDYYELISGQLNDDRLGRALERIAQYGDIVQSALVLRMIKEFDLRVKQIHYDISNVELFGAYERQLKRQIKEDSGTPLPAYGRPKSGRKNVKQIQFGLNVAADGAVPIGVLPLNGNAAEAPSHLVNLKLLDSLLPKDDFLYLGDSKLDSDENLLAIAARKGRFLCAGALLPHLQGLFLKERGKLRVIDYSPKSQAQLPAKERDQYKAFEVRQQLLGEVDGRGIRLKYRIIFVWSEAKARQEAETRERHLSKIREEFETVERNLNKYNLKTEEAIVGRLERMKGKYTIGSVFKYELKKKRQGKFALTWKVDNKELKRRKALEGVYILKTNLAARNYPTAKTLSTYKEQIHVERRIANLKGPLAVAPMFLEKPERMKGLLYILVWALSIMALMERAVRRNLKGKPMFGLYPENRPSSAPTGKSLLDCFSSLCIVIIKERGVTQRRLADLSPVQQTLIKLLGIPPGALRTFKRRCGT